MKLLLIVTLIFTVSCTLSNQYDQTQLETVKNKNTDEKIKTYFYLLSNISDDDISRTFELSYPQASALNALEAIKDKKYIFTFVKALDNDSPIIRQAAISQMKRHNYKLAIPKLISIMKDDAVQQIQFDAMDALGWLNAKSACNDLVLLTKQHKKRILISRALTALTDIKCIQAKTILLAYFESGVINKLGPYLTNTIYTVLPKLKTPEFIPYLEKLTLKNNEPNLTVLSALQKIGGPKVVSFLESELTGKKSQNYKLEIVQYLLKFNTKKTDIVIFDYIDNEQDSEVRRLIYSVIQRKYFDINRRLKFSRRLLNNYSKETNNETKYKIAYLLENTIQKKDINKIKNIINTEKNSNSKCRLIHNFSLIATIKHYEYMLKFDSLIYPLSCRIPVIKYFGNLKNSKVNKYLNLKYKSEKLLKYTYLHAIGKYPSPNNKSLLLKIIANKSADGRRTAASVLPNQNIEHDWKIIKKIFLYNNDDYAIKKYLLNSIALFNHDDAINVLKTALKNFNIREKVTSILQKKGYSYKQIQSFL